MSSKGQVFAKSTIDFISKTEGLVYFELVGIPWCADFLYKYKIIYIFQTITGPVLGDVMDKTSKFDINSLTLLGPPNSWALDQRIFWWRENSTAVLIKFHFWDRFAK